jgi:streptomycin 6-kinase
VRVQVPDAFARSTVEREGAAGRRWIDSLPAIAAELVERWGLVVRDAPRHGYVALVVPVTRDGDPLALRIGWLDASSRQEALVLRHWDGDGAVRLLDEDERSGALLLEWLDPDRSLRSIPADDATSLAARLLRRLAVAAPPELVSVATEVQGLTESLRARWKTAGRPFRESLIDRAIEICRDEGSGTERVVNRDLHYDNVLAGTREPWLVIDPKALAGPIEFGVAQLLWNRFDELRNHSGIRRRIEIVSDAAELDRELLERWLWAIEEGLDDDAARCGLLVGWLS